jgi:hypothetical protein
MNTGSSIKFKVTKDAARYGDRRSRAWRFEAKVGAIGVPDGAVFHENGGRHGALVRYGE